MPWSSERKSPKFMGWVVRSKLAKGEQQGLSSHLKANCGGLVTSVFLNFLTLENWVTPASWWGRVLSHAEAMPGNHPVESSLVQALCVKRTIPANWTELQGLESFWVSSKSECNLGLVTCVKATMWQLVFQVVKTGMSIAPIPAITAPCLVWTCSHKKNIICCSIS